jgi:hypothetical protein
MVLPGISKIILAKGGHGLENVRLNLFSVTELVSQNTPTQFVKHA